MIDGLQLCGRRTFCSISSHPDHDKQIVIIRYIVHPISFQFNSFHFISTHVKHRSAIFYFYLQEILASFLRV